LLAGYALKKCTNKKKRKERKGKEKRVKEIVFAEKRGENWGVRGALTMTKVPSSAAPPNHHPRLAVESEKFAKVRGGKSYKK